MKVYTGKRSIILNLKKLIEDNKNIITNTYSTYEEIQKVAEKVF